MFFKDIVVPIIKPAKPTNPIKVFFIIINALPAPVVTCHRAVVCKSAGKSKPNVDKDSAPEQIERQNIWNQRIVIKKILCPNLEKKKIELLTNQRNELFKPWNEYGHNNCKDYTIPNLKKINKSITVRSNVRISNSIFTYM